MLDSMIKISPELINKFLSNQCTADEAIMVKAYLDTYTNELEKYVPLDSLLNNESLEELNANTSQKILHQINQEIVKKSSKIIVLKWLKYSAAAVVIGLVIFSGSQLFKNSLLPKNAGPIVGNVIDSATNSITLKTVTNTTTKAMLVVLQDCSAVNLFPKSTLQFAQPFINNKRQLFLAGTAFFKVAKDKTKPFIVTTEGINTTALGTSFTIFSEQQSNNITVQLFTGKVMISKAVTSSYAFNTQYLLPGQQIHVNKATYAANFSTFKLKDSDKKIEKQPLAALQDGLLNFHQTSLPEVLSSLEKQFKVTITYKTSELAHMRFTGFFNQNENVATILNNIALLNGLIVTKTNTGFEIKK